MAAEAFNPITHVADSHEIELFPTAGLTIHLPWGITKFHVLVALSAIIVAWAFIWLAKRIQNGERPQGRLVNFLEFILVFIRDQVARPSIGEHDFRRFLPFLWTSFLFILVMNLLGMLPFLGSATANLAVTGVLAGISFVVIHYNGIVANHGFKNYMKTFIPHIDTNDPVMKYMGPPLLVGMFFLELLSAIIRGVVLAVRLFANMLAGHTALVVVLSFIMLAGQSAASGSSQASTFFWPITFSSVVVVILLSLLELFVACLQAFVFTFLTAIFIGLAINPQH
jgi:F-type H+-transporting ATPase subunit a